MCCSQGDRDVYAKTAADQQEITSAIDAFGSVQSLEPGMALKWTER